MLLPLIQSVRSLYERCQSLVRIAGCKLDLFLVRVWILPRLQFVTDSVHNFSGQDF